MANQGYSILFSKERKAGRLEAWTWKMRFRKGLRLSDNAALVEVRLVSVATEPFLSFFPVQFPGFQSWCETCLQRPKSHGTVRPGEGPLILTQFA